ncbi:hypothetical protein COX27_00540 [Candidatus Kuenenbacteria bacterium CG23_combo_of_CG06-09_8_20_14_all_36_9]|uniref:ParB-like N-terminal domain-containing protein n=1 Tax=Candidatus Kuenenbacteria bacterium CG10_big_fil_rev_8_21_14_0_10_36_11 TaxID=1974618 RepID=A0A2M6WAF9_9BACT|nr:MAG: hypothetical protein COX27_00540 [Candidatus Kuenenbacteria bacterium CG23_combo_of_CG06-09_8_20_14_all_36_9]PIT89789.1 MAG: hypothetical protein COU23_01960 [Candidatus Kuenenbacteria bacterium CG10_big_fil_rev_8_21_14_0_10_36_11]
MSIPDLSQKSLGRGLSSLINNNPNLQNRPSISANDLSYLPKIKKGVANQILALNVNQIKTNPHQPRQDFAEIPLNDLVASIKEHGILQPLLVTETLAGEYELIAGERRLRAAKIAGLNEVPVIIRSAKDLEKLELSLIENIQRQDLNPIEKARSYKKLTEEFGLTHDEAAKRLGISRAQFSNFLRLLNLPDNVQKGLAENRISVGQAKVLLEVKDDNKREQIYRQATATGMTVEDTKKQVDKVKVHAYVREIKKDPQIRDWEIKMQEKLNTKVSIRRRGSWGGIIEIEYYSEEELEETINKILN